MGKRHGLFGMVGAVLTAVGAAAVIKYLKDYTDFKEAAESDIHELEGSAGEVKDAAKRTYTSLSHGNGGELKAAAGDLAKAAGNAVRDAGSLAKTAGQSAVQHVKDMKEKYSEDPEAVKSEVVGNFKDMAYDVTQKVSEVSARVGEKLKPDDIKAEFEEVKESVSESANNLAEDAEEAAEAVKDAAETAEKAGKDAAEAVEETVKDAADTAGAAVKETAGAAKEAVQETVSNAEKEAAKIVEEK